MKNILFLQIYGGGGISGGTEVYLKNLIKELKKSDTNSSLVVSTFNKRNSIFTSYAAVNDSIFTRFLENWNVVTMGYKYPLLGFLQYIWGIFWLYQISSKILSQKKIQVIYSNGGILTAIVSYLLFKKFKIPYILHFHGLFNFKELFRTDIFSLKSFFIIPILRNSFMNASQLVANSQEVAEDINSIDGLPTRAKVIHCFVDTEIFYPKDKMASRKKLKLPTDSFIFLSPNRLDRHKGTDFLLSTIPLIENQNIRFIFIGDGKLKPQIIKLTKQDKRVMYIPQIQNDILPLYLGAADIVWGAASVHYIGLSIIEALACGRPIMALNTPLPADNDFKTLVDPKTIPDNVGYLIEKNPKVFTNQIERLIQNKNLIEKKAIHTVDYYNQVYGKTNFDKISQIIYNVITVS